MIVFLLVFFSFNCWGFVHPNAIKSGVLELESTLEFENLGIKDHKQRNSTQAEKDIKKQILTDFQSRINDDFTIPRYFKDSVSFWFDVYTQYNSSTVVIHDMENLDLVYAVIDFSDLFDSNIHRFTKAKLVKTLSGEHLKKIKNSLKKIQSSKRLNSFDREIKKKVESALGKIAKNKKKRSRLIKKLLKNLRTQTGQRDYIFHGLLRYLSLEPFLLDQIENFNLPKEVLAIAFLESSFNVKAVSKVDASGIWQFMPFIGNLFMPKIDKNIDYRQSPVVSSIAAFHLLKQNKRILKRWDLAITAYNSGTKHLVKAKRKFKKRKNVDLPYILQNYKTKHLGFASKNFYAEFLALVHVLAYQESIFSTKGYKIERYENVGVYLSKCKFGKNSFRYINEGNKAELNFHLQKPKKALAPGVILASEKNLSPKYYLKLSQKEITKKYPKNYTIYLKNKKCGRL